MFYDSISTPKYDTEQNMIEAIKQSRIESKTRALISAFEKIVVAASNIWINEDLNCENVHASRSKVNVGGNTQRLVNKVGPTGQIPPLV